MKPVTKLPAATISRAIVQAIGELQDLGQEPRISDIALFLSCTKATAKKHIDKAVWAKMVTQNVQGYRNSATLITYELTNFGRKKFNSPECLDAKSAVYAVKGILI